MIEGKTVLAITLARGGSKSIPKKNIVPICGKPLIGYTIDEVFKCKYIDKYLVSTDDSEIAQYCRDMGADIVDRPVELSGDNAKSSESLIHAVKSINFQYDYIVEVMATNPLKTSDDIRNCIVLLNSSNADSVVAVVRIYDHHPSRVKYIENGILKDFYPEVPESNRQSLSPAAYVRCGSIYAMKRNFLLDKNSRYDKNTLAYIMPPERVINIDEPMDLKMAETLLGERNENSCSK